MKLLFALLPVALAVPMTAGAASAAPATISGHFAYQGGQLITRGYMRTASIGSDPLDQRIDIWMTSTSSPAPIKDYAVEMTKKLHVVIVSDDFRLFMHIHPILGPDGHFRLDQKFPAPGSYHLYADGEPNGGDHQVFRFDFNVGKPSAAAPMDLSDTGREVNIGPYTVDLSKARLTAGSTDTIEVQILKGDSPAKDLHPYLGVPAHAVFLNSSDLSYVHVHPLPIGSAPMDMSKMSPADMRNMTMDLPDTASSPPDMMLYVSVKEPGTYKLWLQFRGGDQLYIAPFILPAN